MRTNNFTRLLIRHALPLESAEFKMFFLSTRSVSSAKFERGFSSAPLDSNDVRSRSRKSDGRLSNYARNCERPLSVEKQD